MGFTVGLCLSISSKVAAVDGRREEDLQSPGQSALQRRSQYGRRANALGRSWSIEIPQRARRAGALAGGHGKRSDLTSWLEHTHNTQDRRRSRRDYPVDQESSQLSRRARTKRASTGKKTTSYAQLCTRSRRKRLRGLQCGRRRCMTRLRRPGFHHAIVEGFARGDGEMFLRKYERTCNFPPLDRTGPRDKGSRGRNVRSRCRCSLSPAIRISSRGWPRSSSTDEPSDPPSRVFSVFGFGFYLILVLGVYERLKKRTDERKGCCTELASGLGTARGGLLSRLRGRRRTLICLLPESERRTGRRRRPAARR